ncbi:non-canonical purine NTP pyrophosphatase [Prosthecobacter sp.]|uniref:non-canonical purine NTP pyrophosphatase n=1 Tax=Prosthecobacter sp. TaxID=1965333 RepID=UPI002ABAE6C5|nr:non-canonical purine NTP pyrophosphatase [Prosthecobacter sp.]MDZ4405641.1 non-canonical purine NTP pyrophosphatase [Prosthecobacter sp.]
MPSLLFATSNAHKTEEVAAILGSAWQVEDLRAHPGITLDEETGDTFEANAIIKAVSGSRGAPGLLVLADDSGLEVDALGGAPGVRSARYAGETATAADNRAKLKAELTKKAMYSRFIGRFHCCMVLARDGEVLHVTHGSVEGRLITHEVGEGGFGYDSLFIPDGFTETFGVLPAETKNQLSHRARALAAMKKKLAALR